jgi:hypothetical protein
MTDQFFSALAGSRSLEQALLKTFLKGPELEPRVLECVWVRFTMLVCPLDWQCKLWTGAHFQVYQDANKPAPGSY